MKIAFLSFYSGVIYRGAETYVHEVANRLVSMGHDVVVYQNGPAISGSRYKSVTQDIQVKFLEKGTGGALVNQFIDIDAVRRFAASSLRQMDYSTEIVVATNNRWQALLCKLWTVGHKSKLVIPGQGGPGLDERIALFCFPDVFISLSNYQLSWARKVNPFVKTTKIPNGVDLNKFSPGAKPFKFDLPKPIVLCVAALWPWMKRQHLLIRAMSKLKMGSLLLVGDGEGKEQLKKLGQKLLGDRFAMKAFSYSEMPSVYPGSDLFSFPTSSWESFGIVLVEAMASGLPVVANDDPIRREIVGNAGFFVNPENTEVYARALQRALDTNWGDKPRKQAEKFGWDKIARQYEVLFQSLVK